MFSEYFITNEVEYLFEILSNEGRIYGVKNKNKINSMVTTNLTSTKAKTS